MPVHTFTCRACEHVYEHWKLKTTDPEAPKSYDCPGCGVTLLRDATLIARTDHRWGESHAYFDRGLGQMVTGSVDRERKAAKLGLVPLEDLGGDAAFDSSVQECINERDLQEREAATFNRHLKETGSVGAATIATWPHSELS